ncbi:hypothetical protein PAPHI01_1572 [Pancytospora philotis]|nr:hypothetical protein PAPHI01_1572 [Pancytospora philotis]
METGNVDEKNVITRTNLGVVPTTAEQMDERRRNTVVLDYLRKLDEAKQWIEGELGASMELSAFIDALPRGELLADVARRFDGGITGRVHRSEKKEYMHTDNINMFLDWLGRVKLSRHFFFEVIDLYDAKDIPKVIYCIHGLAHFLRMRGMTGGISRSVRVFSEADEALVGADMSKIEGRCYDDIENRLASEEEEPALPAADFSAGAAAPVCLNKTLTGQRASVIRQFARTFLLAGLFRAVRSADYATVPAIRRFLRYDANTDEEERMLEESSRAIFEKFKDNFVMQEEKDGLLRAVRLLLENQSRLRGIEVEGSPVANDYRIFKRVVYNLIHDYELVYQILQAGYELPLRMFYQDDRVGDYHFAKLTEHVYEKHGEERAMQLASQHFATSRVFRTLTQLFANGASSQFILNPVEVHDAVYSSSDRRVLRDEAIKDPLVVEEIVRRGRFVQSFLGERLEYLRKIDLPYYARIFVRHSGFYEEFIEKAVLLSDSFVVAELIKYIFYSRQLFVGDVRKDENGDLVYYESKMDRTRHFDLSDYSPLRDWLEADRHKSFHTDFVERHAPAESANSAVLDEAVADECVQLETSLDEINSLIIVLKENIALMGGVMSSLVAKMTLLKQQPSDAVLVSVAYPGADSCVVDSIYQDSAEGNGAHTASTVVALEPSPKQGAAPAHRSCTTPSNIMKQRFVLKLDTQFIDLESDAQFAIAGILNSLKGRIVLLISLSTAQTLQAILKTTSEAERAKFRDYSHICGDIEALKQSVVEDLEFLSSKRIISSASGYQSVLNMIANDIGKPVSSRRHALSLNSDTLDALFKKGIFLRQELDSLYAYFQALSSKMVTNKSGCIFNRQCAPFSAYGTYRYPLAVLNPLIFEDLDISSFKFTISMEQPLVFSLAVSLLDQHWDSFNNIRFDELLRLREDGVPCFDCNGAMSLNVNNLISIINEQYIKYE